MRALSKLLALGIAMQDYACAEPFQCPEPIKQLDSTLQGSISGKAQALLKLGDVNFTGGVQTSVVNLLEKYPNADRIAIAQTLQSMTCQVLRNSGSLSDSQKLDRILDLARALEPYLK
ncbi:hypothetical protein [Methylocystis sp.]|uniref:hypothetical protein n=1 Tax=Methylocystis sp. TaxID=1911079 RepID=UPI003D0FE902